MSMKSYSPRLRTVRSILRSSTFTTWGIVAAAGCSAPGEPSLTSDGTNPADLQCGGTEQVPGVTSFLAATSAVQSVAGSIQSDVRAQLESLAQELGLETSSSSSLSELAAQVEAAMIGAFGGHVEGLSLVHEPTSCLLDTDVAGTAAAECDPAIDPATALVECLGACVGLPGASLVCEGDAVLYCEAPLPGIDCSTDCVGMCATELVGEACVGTCIGTCEGICTSPALDGSCNGSCIGLCSGSCGLVSDGGACDGACLGECITAPGSPACDDAATPSCEPGASGTVECSDLCEGIVAVPGVIEECIAPVGALANAATSCVPPPSQVQLTFTGQTDDDTKADLQLLADDVAVGMSAMLAQQAQAQTLLDSALSPVSGLLAVVEELIGSVTALLGEPDASCVVEELQGATDVLQTAQGNLEDAVQAVGILDGALAGLGG